MIAMINANHAACAKAVTPAYGGEPASVTAVKAWDIDKAFDWLDKNTKGISKMIKELNNVMMKLQRLMRLKSAAREAMTESQIMALAAFQDYYDEEVEFLTASLARLSGDIGTGGLKTGPFSL